MMPADTGWPEAAVDSTKRHAPKKAIKIRISCKDAIGSGPSAYTHYVNQRSQTSYSVTHGGDFGRHGFGCGSRARLARAAVCASTGVRHSGTVLSGVLDSTPSR